MRPPLRHTLNVDRLPPLDDAFSGAASAGEDALWKNAAEYERHDEDQERGVLSWAQAKLGMERARHAAERAEEHASERSRRLLRRKAPEGAPASPGERASAREA